MKEVFQFGKKRSKTEKARPFHPAKTAKTEEGMGLIQGRKPGSRQEWYFALALWSLKLDFEYQKPIGGGNSVRGGQIIDFFVYTVPLPTPVYIQGTYWHRPAKRMEDILKVEKAKQYFQGAAADPELIPEEELPDAGMALSVARRRLL